MILVSFPFPRRASSIAQRRCCERQAMSDRGSCEKRNVARRGSSGPSVCRWDRLWRSLQHHPPHSQTLCAVRDAMLSAERHCSFVIYQNFRIFPDCVSTGTPTVWTSQRPSSEGHCCVRRPSAQGPPSVTESSSALTDD